MVLPLALSSEEIEAKKWNPKHLEHAVEMFRVHGFLCLENLFSAAKIEEFYSEALSHYVFNEEMTEIVNGARVGPRRYIVPLELKGPFLTVELYANPFLMELFRLLLGPFFRLSSVGTVTSLPGAMNQHIHADHMPLFLEKKELNAILPSYAITVAIPLVDIDFLNGPTIIWSGSHLIHPVDLSMKSHTKVLLHGKRGVCYLWDYRTFHTGSSNHSDAIRPLLYMGYMRSWFQDMVNPDELRISQEELEGLSPEHRELLAPSRYRYRDRELKPV